MQALSVLETCPADTIGIATDRSVDCEAPHFVRGDGDGDGSHSITDAIKILRQLFAGEEIPCHDAADVDDDGSLDITDPIYLLRTLFLGGPSISEPQGSCGIDPTADALSCFQSC